MFNLKKNLEGTIFSLELVFPSKSARCDMYSLSYSDQSSVSPSRKPSSSFVPSNKCMEKKKSVKFCVYVEMKIVCLTLHSNGLMFLVNTIAAAT